MPPEWSTSAQIAKVIAASARTTGTKIAADAVRELLHRSLGGLRLLHKAEHLPEHAVSADGSGAVFERSVVIKGAADEAIANAARHRNGLACDE